MAPKKIALVLSGCGYLDGAEITEAVSLLIALHQQGAETVCFAPDVEIAPTDHTSGQPLSSGKRNLLSEANRIARGRAKNLAELKAKDFDGLAFAGGFGAALHLSDWAKKGAQAQVLPDVTRVIKDFHAEGKPIGAVCIAPTLLAKVLGPKGAHVTIGDDKETAMEIEKTGAHHIACPVDDFVTDRENKLVTSPAYMYEAKPHQVFKGIQGLAKELVEMA